MRNRVDTDYTQEQLCNRDNNNMTRERDKNSANRGTGHTEEETDMTHKMGDIVRHIKRGG